MLLKQEETLNILNQKEKLNSTHKHDCDHCNFKSHPYGSIFKKELITNDELDTQPALVFLEYRFQGDVGIVVNQHFIEIMYCPICGRKL